jgi:hypothetical protein
MTCPNWSMARTGSARSPRPSSTFRRRASDLRPRCWRARAASANSGAKRWTHL